MIFLYLLSLFSFFTPIDSEDLQVRVLNSEETLNGTLFATGTKVFTDSKDRIVKVQLAKRQSIMNKVSETPIFPYRFPEKTTIYYQSQNGEWNQPGYVPDRILAPRSFRLRKIIIRKNTEVHFSGGSFLINGKNFYLIDFYYKLSQDTEINKKLIPANTSILVTSEGQIKKLENGKWIDI